MQEVPQRFGRQDDLVLRPLLRLLPLPEPLALWLLVAPRLDWSVESDCTVSKVPEWLLLRLRLRSRFASVWHWLPPLMRL